MHRSAGSGKTLPYSRAFPDDLGAIGGYSSVSTPPGHSAVTVTRRPRARVRTPAKTTERRTSSPRRPPPRGEIKRGHDAVFGLHSVGERFEPIFTPSRHHQIVGVGRDEFREFPSDPARCPVTSAVRPSASLDNMLESLFAASITIGPSVAISPDRVESDSSRARPTRPARSYRASRRPSGLSPCRGPYPRGSRVCSPP